MTLAKHGMHNPDEPESPAVISNPIPWIGRLWRTRQSAIPTLRPNATHDAPATALRHILSTGVLCSHRVLPVTAIITRTVQQVEHACGLVTTRNRGSGPDPPRTRHD
ncbi:hypothetical protein REQ_09570 [Prescottella equi 103S]|uniref:Uncharacterized protein n=1 Tax=Rhodococcus hoagii (strain 103S) TaxID=685727 RepID=A0A3S5Y3D0_RHOH1|nr:hypothetical protein REQ_09570 [Prescottella equi 103S]